LFLVAVLAVCFWFAKPDDRRGLAFNLLSEITGITLTVFVLDRIIQHRDFQNSLPQRFATYRDVSSFSGYVLKHWLSAYQSCMEFDSPNQIEQFVTPAMFKAILDTIDLNSTVPKLAPPRTWWDETVRYAVGARAFGERILNRANSMDPRAYGWMLSIVERGFLTTIMQWRSVRDAPKMLGLSAKTKINYTVFPSADECANILSLYHWCFAEFEELRQEGTPEPPFRYSVVKGTANSPSKRQAPDADPTRVSSANPPAANS
jgi:hypothetical protein